MGEKIRDGAAPSRLGHDIVKILSAKNTPQQLVDEVIDIRVSPLAHADNRSGDCRWMSV